MNHPTTTASFEDTALYVGIDVHRKRWVVSLRSAGIELKTFSMNPSPEELAEHLRRHYPGARYLSVYEAGYCGYWIHERLTRLGLENLVVHPADVPTTGKERSGKCDKRDSKKLARERETGSLTPIFVPSSKMQQLRTLSRLRFRLAAHQTRLKNRIKSMVAFYGHPLPRRDEMCHWTAAFIQYLRDLEFTDEIARECLDYCLDELEETRVRQAQVLKRLERHVAEADTEGITEMLRTVPGVGRVTTLTLYCELIDMNRFGRFDQLASYVGLVPSMHDSGTKQRRAGLNHRRNRYLRSILIEAAWIAVRQDPTLTASFAQLTRRMKKQEAIVRIAKKLLRRIRHVWKNRCPYEPPAVPTT